MLSECTSKPDEIAFDPFCLLDGVFWEYHKRIFTLFSFQPIEKSCTLSLDINVCFLLRRWWQVIVEAASLFFATYSHSYDSVCVTGLDDAVDTRNDHALVEFIVVLPRSPERQSLSKHVIFSDISRLFTESSFLLSARAAAKSIKRLTRSRSGPQRTTPIVCRAVCIRIPIFTTSERFFLQVLNIKEQLLLFGADSRSAISLELHELPEYRANLRILEQAGSLFCQVSDGSMAGFLTDSHETASTILAYPTVCLLWWLGALLFWVALVGKMGATISEFNILLEFLSWFLNFLNRLGQSVAKTKRILIVAFISRQVSH